MILFEEEKEIKTLISGLQLTTFRIRKKKKFCFFSIQKSCFLIDIASITFEIKQKIEYLVGSIISGFLLFLLAINFNFWQDLATDFNYRYFTTTYYTFVWSLVFLIAFFAISYLISLVPKLIVFTANDSLSFNINFKEVHRIKELIELIENIKHQRQMDLLFFFKQVNKSI